MIIKFCLVFPKIFLLHKVVRDAKKFKKHWNTQPLRAQNRYWIVWALLINLLELSINDKARMMLIMQSQVCGYIRACQVLSHQKTKQINDARKSQINQETWNGTVLKRGSENQLAIHNYDLSIHFLWFSADRTIWKESRASQFYCVCSAHLRV